MTARLVKIVLSLAALAAVAAGFWWALAERPVAVETVKVASAPMAVTIEEDGETRVREIMAAPVLTVDPDETVEACMEMMTDRRLRHLPVLANGRLVGIVSIGDLVKSIISEQEHVIEQLQLFIQS